MSSQIISTINNKEIVIVTAQNGERLVPIKPICEAFGIDYSTQLKKVKENEILFPVVGLSPTTGADGKQYEMMCIPLKYVFGWLFTISSKNVNEDAKTGLIEYQKMCYDALYDYFSAHAQYIEEKEQKLGVYLDKERDARERFRNAEKVLKEIRNEMQEFRKISFDDWKALRNQTRLSFSN